MFNISQQILVLINKPYRVYVTLKMGPWRLSRQLLLQSISCSFWTQIAINLINIIHSYTLLRSIGS